MGGNVFTHLGYKAHRMDIPTYNKVLDKVHSFLDELNITYYDIPYVRNKADFGDIDIIIEYAIDEHVFDAIRTNTTKLGATDETTIRNGKVLSVLVDGLYQVDFIKERKETVEYHIAYLSHNDLGNLIGRCVKEAGYKHGTDGLFYSHYMNGRALKKDFFISNDYRTVLNLLGLSVEKFDAGFDTLEDMFDYVSSNKYFKASFYKFENLNNKNKVRDAKRKNYNLFLNHVKDMVDSELSLPTYDVSFPHLVPLVVEYEEKVRRDKVVKDKFSGKMVMQLTSLQGKDLGDFMQFFKEKYDVYSMTPKEINDYVLKEYNLL